MSSVQKLAAVCCATLFVIIICFYLPQIIGNIQDSKMINELKNEKYEPMVNGDSVKTGFFDKLYLASGSYSSEGGYYSDFRLEDEMAPDGNFAIQTVKNDLPNFLFNGVEPTEISFQKAVLAISNIKFGKKAVLWFFETVNSDNSKSEVVMDGESGKILSVICSRDDKKFPFRYVDGGLADGMGKLISRILSEKYEAYSRLALKSLERKDMTGTYYATYSYGPETMDVCVTVTEYSYSFNRYTLKDSYTGDY